MLQPIQARADEQARVRDAYACMNATIELEKEYQIQEHLLTTISSVETGRWDAATRQNVAWPWTVNAMGKGTFYPSKAEAIRAVKKLQAQGVKSIDVGCMQINLSYHPDAFENLEEAFDPKTNVAYGAKFLKNLYKIAETTGLKPQWPTIRAFRKRRCAIRKNCLPRMKK